MKILVVCQYYYPEPFRVTDICENLVERGHQVTVLTGLPNYPEGVIPSEYRHRKKRNEEINGVNVLRCYEIPRGHSKVKLFLSYFSYAMSATLKALFLKEEFDVILVNQLSPVMMGIPAMAYKKKKKKKIVFYCLDLWPDSLAAGGVNQNSFIYRTFYKMSQWIYRSADLLLVTSSTFENYFKETLNIKNIKVKYLPQYAEDLFENAEVISHKTKNDKFKFVFAGNIGDMQSVDTIIKAANELKDVENIEIHIVGEGSKLEECRQLSGDLKLSNIIYHGRKPIEEMPLYYEMADAMLVTLKANKVLSLTLPGKVQSYMASGKPIIGSIDGETRSIVERAECGFTCPAEDYKALAILMKEFCETPDKFKLGINAKRYYMENFNKNKFMIELENSLFQMGD